MIGSEYPVFPEWKHLERVSLRHESETTAKSTPLFSFLSSMSPKRTRNVMPHRFTLVQTYSPQFIIFMLKVFIILCWNQFKIQIFIALIEMIKELLYSVLIIGIKKK